MLAWSGTFPILWLSCFHVQLVPCGSDISTWDHMVPGLNRTCIGIVSEYLTMYLAYCYCVPGTSHACTLRATPRQHAYLVRCTQLPFCTSNVVPMHPAYRTSAPCVPYQCTLRTVPVYPAYRTGVPCIPYPDNVRTLNTIPSCLSVPQMSYPCTLRTVPMYPAYRTSAPCVPYPRTKSSVPYQKVKAYPITIAI